VETFNGAPLRSLAHLAHLVDGCRGEGDLSFGLEGGRTCVLGAADAARALPEILEANGIASDRSGDLAYDAAAEGDWDASGGAAVAAAAAAGLDPEASADESS
jgi:hypothetical protein